LLNAYTFKEKTPKGEAKMPENSLLEAIKESYFTGKTIKLEELKKNFQQLMPLEGYVDAELISEDGIETIVLKDYYNEDKWDVADFLCKLKLSSEGTIQAVEHDLPPFCNEKNKGIILFFGSLVGKRLKLKEEDDDKDPLEPVVDYLYDERNDS